MGKRIFDLIVSFFALLLLSPFLIIVSFLIFLQDYKNPIYVSRRIGINGKEFSFFKLRSMTVDADSSGVDSTKSSDPRITVIGKFIRKYKIDELSQLFNVFLGDMSLVGPRPERPHFVFRPSGLFRFRRMWLRGGRGNLFLHGVVL